MRFRSSWICRSICILLFLIELSGAKPFGKGNHNRAHNNHRNNNNHHRRRAGDTPSGDDDDDNHNHFNDDTLSHVKVSCRNQWYEIHHVTTVSDVLHQVQHQPSSSLLSHDVDTARLLYRGKILENHKDKLKDHGIQDGDTIFVAPDNYRFKPHEALAIFLEMLAKDDNQHTNKNNNNGEDEEDSTNSPLAKLFGLLQDESVGELLSSWDDLFHHVQKDEITHWIRTELDLGYHRLRLLWEQPTFRQALMNPTPIEVYRQVLANHLPKSIQKVLSPSTQQIIHNPRIWQKHVLEWMDGILRFGDLILDSLLDVVLDVVQGAGQTSTTSALSTQFTNTPSTSSQQQQDQQQQQPKPDGHYQPTMEDPTMANQMLFELSESEED